MEAQAENVRGFVEHMVENHSWDIPAILYFLGKPWKWEREMIQYMTDGKVEASDE